MCVCIFAFVFVRVCVFVCVSLCVCDRVFVCVQGGWWDVGGEEGECICRSSVTYVFDSCHTYKILTSHV